MLKGDWHVGACIFAGLYLACDDWGTAPIRRWSQVADCLSSGHDGTVLSRLRSSGFWEEAVLLDEPRRLSRAEEWVNRGQVLTVFDSRYPSGWLAGLGSGAPPALWCEGEVPAAELVGVVGSRDLPLETQMFARQVGGHLVATGLGVVSGGAWGSDELGVAGALARSGSAPVVQILPCGLDSSGYGKARFDGCLLSLFSRQASFSGGQAMIRNRLIYSWSRRAVVVHSRFKVGGTWGGATDALRRGLGRLIVADWGDRATEGLVALGGDRLGLGRDWRSDLDYRLRQPLPVAQPDLFGFIGVRESGSNYCVFPHVAAALA